MRNGAETIFKASAHLLCAGTNIPRMRPDRANVWPHIVNVSLPIANVCAAIADVFAYIANVSPHIGSGERLSPMSALTSSMSALPLPVAWLTSARERGYQGYLGSHGEYVGSSWLCLACNRRWEARFRAC